MGSIKVSQQEMTYTGADGPYNLVGFWGGYLRWGE